MWKKVIVNSNLIKHETNGAYLIKIPKQNKMFWFPKKCVRFKGKNDYLMVLSYTDGFEFRIKDGKSMCVAEWESFFDIEENERHVPDTLSIDQEVNVDESLIG